MFSSLASLALLYLAALIIPGPNLLLLTHTAAAASRRAALGVALGIATGTFMWVAVAVFGVQKIFDALPMLQTALRLAGGVYLLYLAFALLRSLWVDRTSAHRTPSRADTINETLPPASPDVAAATQLVFFRRGLLTNLTNPKSLAFWTSVAIVSIDPDAALATRIAAVLMVGLMGLIWHIALAYLFSTGPAQRAYMQARPVLSIITSVVMAVFGARLLWGLRG
jgi:threonine/homoserine/homoserine lactone efflux protein